MAKGGKTNEQMKKLGRNLAKLANQKSGKKPVKDMGKVVKNG
jgi:ribosomal protein L18E